MPNRIDVTDVRSLLRTRGELLVKGHTEREIGSRVAAGSLRRVRRGRYIEADRWDGLWNEGRHLVEVVAAALNSDGPGPVFWGPSAAVLHGLPLYRLAPRKVHAVIAGARHGRTRSGVMWHDVEVPLAEVVDVDGIRCTSLDRTILDLACSSREEVGLSAADAALRREAVSGQVQDAGAVEGWRARMMARALRSHSRGVRRARRVIEFADGRAQLPGESVSRLQLHRLGFAAPELQVHVRGPGGEDYWVDFGFRRSHCFGEFDGEDKYRNAILRRGRSVEEVVLEEKRREDAIRGVTGWRLVRWGSSDIASPDALGATLSAYGIRPPG